MSRFTFRLLADGTNAGKWGVFDKEYSMLQPIEIQEHEAFAMASVRELTMEERPPIWPTKGGTMLVCGVCYGARGDGAYLRAVDIRQAVPAEYPDVFDYGDLIGRGWLPLCDICWAEDACILVAPDDGRRWADWRNPK